MNWGKAVIFVLLIGCFGQPARAQTDTSVIEREKAVIQQLLGAGKYGQAAGLYEKLADSYHQLYGYNKYTIDAYLNAISLYTRQGDSLGSYNAHMNVGNYYTQDYFMQSYAEEHLTKALVFFQRTNNRPKIIESRLGIANMVAKKEPTPVSLITELKAIERMSAQYRQAYFQTYAQNLLADTYLRLKRPDSAYYYAGLSLASAKTIKVDWLVALNYFYLGIVEQFRNQPRKALAYYQKSYALAEVEKNLTTLRQLSRHTAESYAYLNDYKNAYRFEQRALDFTNQFYYSEQTKSIRLQELNSQIKSLAVEKRLAEEQSQHQQMVNYMLIAVLIVSTLGVVALVFMRRQQKLITHQQSVIAQQQIRQLELKSLRAMIEGQESERSRIARDLHDGLGIQLSRIKLFVEAHDEQLPHAIKEPLNQFLDEACTETRLISNDLRPYALSTFGLVPALEDLVQKLNLVEGPRLAFEHYGELPPLGDEASVMIYRVIQELLNNALKHAHADTITIQLMANDETLLISVDDDGRGNDFAQTTPKGNGIANIRSRIDYLGGQVMWQSEPQRGTSVMISLPMSRLSQLLIQEV